jgi:hypothetical protein
MGGGPGLGGGHTFGGGRLSLHSYGAANGYEENWMAKTKETLEKELKYRGVDPVVINEVVDKIEEPSIVAPVLIAILVTALILTLVFWIVWENT